MSGRCHSLTALFHFGYNAWKQLLGDNVAPSGFRADASAERNPGRMIAEEEAERPREELHEQAEHPTSPLSMHDITDVGQVLSGMVGANTPGATAVASGTSRSVSGLAVAT